MPKADLLGQRFGRLVVQASVRHNGWMRWECLCDCGGKNIVATSTLRQGGVKSCGCYGRETRVKHGHYGSRTYSIWQDMLSRCRNPNTEAYDNYGGRGIKVCERWTVFVAFLEDMGEAPKGLTLDRKDNNADYTPGNCVWASRRAQANNRRTNVYVTVHGKRMTVAAACRAYNLKEQQVADARRKQADVRLGIKRTHQEIIDKLLEDVL